MALAPFENLMKAVGPRSRKMCSMHTFQLIILIGFQTYREELQELC